MHRSLYYQQRKSKSPASTCRAITQQVEPMHSEPIRHELPTLEALQQDLVTLQSPDMDTRCAAFSRLRYVPKSYLKAGWQEVRQQRPTPGRSFDCLGRVQVTPPVVPIRNRHAVTTIISPGYETLLEQLLESLQRSGEVDGVAIVVFVVDGAGERAREYDWRGLDLHFIDCQAIERTSAAIKGAIYSCARWIDIRNYRLARSRYAGRQFSESIVRHTGKFARYNIRWLPSAVRGQALHD